jgi:hypothetical protein
MKSFPGGLAGTCRTVSGPVGCQLLGATRGRAPTSNDAYILARVDNALDEFLNAYLKANE